MASEITAPRRIVRRPKVQADTSYSKSTIYLRVSQGLFPKPLSIGPRAVGWPEDEIAALNAARIAGKDDAAIRRLVQSLEAARSIAA